jgi:hypothetical protein
VPVRLVGKTEYLGSSDSNLTSVSASELAYCKIKLFRDKGAERKLANDRLHVEQALQKLDQQIQQLENDDLGTASNSINSHKKKKRNNSVATSGSDSSPQRRHRRDWSISSSSSNPRTQREELARKQEKRTSILAMPASIHPVSQFSLTGDPADDPSLPSSIAPQSQWEAPGVNGPVVMEEPTKVISALRRSPTLSQISSLSGTGSEASPVVQPMTPPDPLFGRRLRVHAATREVDAMDVDPYYVPQPRPTIRPGMIL